jgi:hypothetical protein
MNVPRMESRTCELENSDRGVDILYGIIALIFWVGRKLKRNRLWLFKWKTIAPHASFDQ